MSAAVRLESVEWDHRPGGVSLEVTGRWRRRRPLGGEPPQLVVEREGERRRVPARPEPPGLAAVAPGTWRLVFSVPDTLVPRPGERAWLRIGGVLLPLPGVEPDEPPAAGGVTASAPESVLAERRLRAAELALEAVRAERVVADARRGELEDELARVAGELAAAREALAERDRARRLAEQREHAERAERQALGAELAALRAEREPDVGDRLALRVEELEGERESLLRRLAEAERALSAARVVRRPAKPDAVPAPSPPMEDTPGPGRAVPPILVRETALATPALMRPVPSIRGPGVVGRSVAGALAVERRLVAASGLRPDRTAASRVEIQRLDGVLRELGGELATLRDALTAERRSRAAAESRAEEAEARAEEAEAWSAAAEVSAADAEARADEAELELAASRRRAEDTHAALERLRMELAERLVPPSPPAVPTGVAGPELRPASPGPPAPGARPVADPAPGLDPDRLDAARSRLRTPLAEPVAPASDWLERALRSLLAVDPAAAGRLVLALLPAHTLADGFAVRYDLVLDDAGVISVDAAGPWASVVVRAAAWPRATADVDFAFQGTLAALGRRVAAGRTHRGGMAGSGADPRIDRRRRSTPPAGAGPSSPARAPGGRGRARRLARPDARRPRHRPGRHPGGAVRGRVRGGG